MPITQTRMVALINAGLDYQQALTKLTEAIKAEYTSAQAHHQDPQTALDNILTAAQPFILLLQPDKSPTTLLQEATHFRRYYHRNTKRASKQATRRLAQGIQPRPTQQTSLLPLPPAIRVQLQDELSLLHPNPTEPPVEPDNTSDTALDEALQKGLLQ